MPWHRRGYRPRTTPAVRTGSGTWCVHSWESLSELVEFCQAHPESVSLSRNVKSHLGQAGHEWFGRTDLNTPEDACKAALEPWPTGMEVVKRFMAKIGDVALPVPVSVSRRKVWQDDTADEYDRDRMISGQAPWQACKRQASAGGSPIVNVVFRIGHSCATSADQILWNGVVAIVLADRLEDAGYRVRIVAADVTDGAYTDGANLIQSVVLKQPEDPVNMHTLISGVSAWMFRTLLFWAHGVEPGRDPSWGLGHAAILKEWNSLAKAAIVPDVPPEDWSSARKDLWAIDGCDSESTAVDAMQRVLKAFHECTESV